VIHLISTRQFGLAVTETQPKPRKPASSPERLDRCSSGDLKSLADEAKQSLGSGIVAIVAAADDGKASLVVGVTGDLTQRFNAVDLVRRGAAALGGKGGGGRPDMAQAGGPEGGKAADALAAVEAAMRDAAA